MKWSTLFLIAFVALKFLRITMVPLSSTHSTATSTNPIHCLNPRRRYRAHCITIDGFSTRDVDRVLDLAARCWTKLACLFSWSDPLRFFFVGFSKRWSVQTTFGGLWRNWRSAYENTKHTFWKEWGRTGEFVKTSVYGSRAVIWILQFLTIK